MCMNTSSDMFVYYQSYSMTEIEHVDLNILYSKPFIGMVDLHSIFTVNILGCNNLLSFSGPSDHTLLKSAKWSISPKCTKIYTSAKVANNSISGDSKWISSSQKLDGKMGSAIISANVTKYDYLNVGASALFLHRMQRKRYLLMSENMFK